MRDTATGEEGVVPELESAEGHGGRWEEVSAPLHQRMVIYCQTPASAPHMLRIVPHAVPRAGRSYEHFPDSFELYPRPSTTPRLHPP